MTVEVRALLIVTAPHDREVDAILGRVRDAALTSYGPSTVIVVEQSRELTEENP